jgi:hypothetical protein
MAASIAVEISPHRNQSQSTTLRSYPASLPFRAMKRVLRTVAIIVMLLAACFHFWRGLGGFFTIIGEDWALQMALIVSGPLTFLPAVVVGIRLPLVGALWLALGAVVTTCSMVMLSGVSDTAGYFLFLPLPMLLAAAAVWFLRVRRQESLLRQAETLELKLRAWLGLSSSRRTARR